MGKTHGALDKADAYLAEAVATQAAASAALQAQKQRVAEAGAAFLAAKFALPPKPPQGPASSGAPPLPALPQPPAPVADTLLFA